MRTNQKNSNFWRWWIKRDLLIIFLMIRLLEIYYTSRNEVSMKRGAIKPLYFNFDDFVKNQSISSIESILNKPNVIVFANYFT